MKPNSCAFGDRLASAAVMAIASFLTGLSLWAFGLLVVMAGSFKTAPPFTWVWILTAIFTGLGFLSPALALNTIGKLWKDVAELLSRTNRSPW